MIKKKLFILLLSISMLNTSINAFAQSPFSLQNNYSNNIYDVPDLEEKIILNEMRSDRLAETSHKNNINIILKIESIVKKAIIKEEKRKERIRKKKEKERQLRLIEKYKKENQNIDKVQSSLNEMLKEEGLNKAARCAMLSSLFYESHYVPSVTNPSSGAYGIRQWLGVRKQRLIDYCSENELEYNSINPAVAREAQLKFWIYELKTCYRSTWDLIINVIDSEEGAGNLAAQILAIEGFSCGPYKDSITAKTTPEECIEYMTLGNSHVSKEAAISATNDRVLYAIALYNVID